MTPELETISKLPGVVGVCFHQDHHVIFQNLPLAYGAATAESLSRAVSRALGTYHQAQRRVSQAYFQYPQSGVLVIVSPRANGQYLSILVQDQATILKLLEPARAFLARQELVA
jgi:hypothetical protein